jgi:hypothetical protein
LDLRVRLLVGIQTFRKPPCEGSEKIISQKRIEFAGLNAPFVFFLDDAGGQVRDRQRDVLEVVLCLFEEEILMRE